MSNEKPVEKPAKKQYIFINTPFMQFEKQLNEIKDRIVKKQLNQQQPS